MFKPTLGTLSRAIEFMVFHRRHKIVIEKLWERLEERYPEDNVFDLRELVLDALDQVILEKHPRIERHVLSRSYQKRAFELTR